jgi:hypothetical protein
MQAPAATPSLISYATFAWVTALVRRGWRERLTLEDVGLNSRLARPPLVRTAELLARYDALPAGSLRWRLWLLARRRLAFSGAFFLAYISLATAYPFLLRGLVLAVGERSLNGLYYALAIGCSAILGTLANQAQTWLNYELGNSLRTLAVALVYRRVLENSTVAQQQRHGHVSVPNLISSDAQKLVEMAPLVHMLWGAPVQIIVAAAMLVAFAGWLALGGIAVLCSIVPINDAIAAKMRRARAARMPISDARVALCSEAVGAMRLIKVSGWEAAVEARILRERRAEMPLIMRELSLYTAQARRCAVPPCAMPVPQHGRAALCCAVLMPRGGSLAPRTLPRQVTVMIVIPQVPRARRFLLPARFCSHTLFSDSTGLHARRLRCAGARWLGRAADG